jgi:hypothetical protein
MHVHFEDSSFLGSDDRLIFPDVPKDHNIFISKGQVVLVGFSTRTAVPLKIKVTCPIKQWKKSNLAAHRLIPEDLNPRQQHHKNLKTS